MVEGQTYRHFKILLCHQNLSIVNQGAGKHTISLPTGIPIKNTAFILFCSDAATFIKNKIKDNYKVTKLVTNDIFFIIINLQEITGKL